MARCTIGHQYQKGSTERAVSRSNVRPGSYICGMTTTAELHPDTPFSLGAAAAFGFGPHTGRPHTGRPHTGRPHTGRDGSGADEMRLAFVTDDLRQHAGVHLIQRPGGTVTAAIDSEADSRAVLGQVRRILSLDHPAAGWLAAGERDPVLGGLQRAHDWLRPVLFHSPYEAAAWSIISARRYRAQAAAVRTRICAAAGATLTVAGQQLPAFPLPADLLAARTLPGMSQDRVARLHAVAQAALDGQLDGGAASGDGAGRGTARPAAAARHRPLLRALILLRATGVADVLPSTSPGCRATSPTSTAPGQSP